MAEFVAYIGAELMMAGVAEATGAFLLGNAAAIATGSLLLGSAAMSASARRKAKAQYNASQVDRLVNVGGTTAPRELVMGRVRKGGSVFFKGSSDTNNTKFVMCIALAAHEIDAVESIYLNDVPVTLDGSGYVTTAPYQISKPVSSAETYTTNSLVLAHAPIDAAHVAVIVGGGEGTESISFTLTGATVTTDAAYSGQTKTVQYQYNDSTSKARIRSYLGTTTQTADAALVGLFPALWTSAHRARGVAYLICEFDYDETAFPSGLPTVTAVVRGAKIYDPRTGTTVWTENPALMARHLLLHPQFGKRTSLTAAEDARITAAANACDTATIYTVGGVAQASRALYKAAIVIPFGTTARDALDDVVQSMVGQWAYAAGAFYVRAGSYTASVQTLTDADLAVVQRGPDGSTSQRPIQITTHRARDQMFNVVTPTIWDAAQDYKQTALTPLKSAALITRDGAELVQDVSLAAVSYAPQALHIAGVLLRDARDPLTVTLPFKLTGYRVELFDTVSLTLSRYGWSAKTFMVMSREWTHDGSISLTLKENTASTYTLDGTFSAQGGADNTALPSPWAVPTVGALTVASGPAEALRQPDGTYITRMRVSWPALTDLSITRGGSVEVQYRDALSVGPWQTAMAAGNETQLVLSDVTAGLHYLVRARARNTIAVGAWGAQVTHEVTGLGTPVFEYREHLEGWTGAATNSVVVLGAAGPYIEALDLFGTWSAVPASWDAWTRWVSSAFTTVTYQGPVRDLGTTVRGALVFDMDVDGACTTLVRYSNISSADCAAMTPVSSSTPFEARWVQARIQVAQTSAAPVIAVRRMSYAVCSTVKTEQVLNLAISTLTADKKISVGDVLLPLSRSFVYITAVFITVRDLRQGTWTWSLLSKSISAGVRVQFRLDGNLENPQFIDINLEGF